MILSSSSLSAVTAKPSIVEDIDFIVGTDSTQFPLADKLRLINAYYYDTSSDILEADGNWEWDDTNKTDFPIGTTTLVDNQRDYQLPSNIVKLLRVEVLDSAGNYQRVEEFDESQVEQALSEFEETNGLPQFYRTIGNSIELYPKPATASVTTTAGLKVYYQRTITEFTNADAAVSPGFDARYHRILSLGPAYDYAYMKGLDTAPRIKEKLDALRTALKSAYANRNKEVKINLKGKVRNYE